MVFVDYQLNRMISQAISVFIGYGYFGLDSSTNTSSPSDTTMDSELDRFTVESIVLNTTNGTYTVTVKIPLLTLNGNTIRRIGGFNASSSGNMGVLEPLPSAYAIDTTHEVRITLTITADAEDIT